MPRTANKTPEQSAQELLEDFGYDSIPVPVDKVAKRLGAQLRYSPLDNELCGMVFIKNDVPIIGVNALHHPNRQRFSIAHEIGHLVLHREHITNKVHVDKGFPVSVLRRDAASATGTERLEIQANQFAAALLIPRKALDEILSEALIDVEEDDSALERFAKKFKVSKATLEYRIRNLPVDSMAVEQ